MRRNLFRWSIAVLVSVWLGMLVPGHGQHGGAFGHLGHAIDPAAAADRHDGEPSHPDSPHDHSRCAICLFASILTPPPPADAVLPRHERLPQSLSHPATTPVAADPILPFHGRAPPTEA